MALSPEERKIAEYGVANGKTKEQVIQAISMYREQTQQATPAKEGVVDRVKGVIGNASQNVREAVLGQGEYAGQNVLQRGVEATAAAFNAAPQTALAVAPEPVRQAADKAGEFIGDQFNKLTSFIGSDPALQKWVTENPDATDKIINSAKTLQAGGEIAGNILSVKGTAKTVQKSAGLTSAAASKTGDAVSNAAKQVKTVASNTIDDFGSRVSSPSVSNATRVSLNPKEALKGTGQDMTVSVGGKLKKLSELTPDENTKMQFSTQKTINKFTEQAKQFKNNRNPANDPTEIVGRRVDAALDFADKKRRVVGKKMGAIEEQYADQQLPIGEKTISNISDMLDGMQTPKFGVDSADAPIVKKLVKDFFELENSGGTVSDRMKFVRSWDKYLNDSKDAFGNFKENATINTKIQNAVKALKEETVDGISRNDKVYRGLRSQYSTYKQLDEIGNALLGKDGALGVRVKGGATVKRALKSNSDAGARQFLTKLKELTGYDAIKDGDLALTAMENVGDFQGLSLLEVLKDGKAGLVSRGFETVQNKVAGDAPTRVNKFIKKGVTP